MCNYKYKLKRNPLENKPCVYPDLYATHTDIFPLTNQLPIDADVGSKNANPGNCNLPWTKYENAVIAWGDNVESAEGADDLEFIFTAPTSAGGQPGAWDGMEVGKFTIWSKPPAPPLKLGSQNLELKWFRSKAGPDASG